MFVWVQLLFMLSFFFLFIIHTGDAQGRIYAAGDAFSLANGCVLMEVAAGFWLAAVLAALLDVV